MVQANRNTTHKNAVSKDESGVSAVIGVILMIAVTVILAAVIGAFVFNYAPNLLPSQGTTPIGFKLDNGSKTLTIINNGGIAAENLFVKVNGYKLVEASGYQLVSNSEYGGLKPADDAAACVPLQDVGGMVKINTGVEGALVTSGMLVTVTGDINGNTVVISTYTVP